MVLKLLSFEGTLPRPPAAVRWGIGGGRRAKTHSLRHFDFLQQQTFGCWPGAALLLAGAAIAEAEADVALLTCAGGAATGAASVVFFCDLLSSATNHDQKRQRDERKGAGGRAYRVQLGAAAGLANPVVLTLLDSGRSSNTTRLVMSNLGPLAC